VLERTTNYQNPEWVFSNETFVLPPFVWLEIYDGILTERHNLQVIEENVRENTSIFHTNEVSREFMILHDDELRDNYGPPTIVRAMKHWRLQWVKCVGRKA
jgi:hypothetical protein